MNQTSAGLWKVRISSSFAYAEGCDFFFPTHEHKIIFKESSQASLVLWSFASALLFLLIYFIPIILHHVKLNAPSLPLYCFLYHCSVASHGSNLLLLMSSSPGMQAPHGDVRALLTSVLRLEWSMNKFCNN